MSEPVLHAAGLEEAFARIPRTLPRAAIGALAGVLALGIATFALGVMGEQPVRAWQIYLVNFLFWAGVAQGGVVFAAIYHLTGARWGDVIRRIAEGMGSFLPVILVLFLPLIAGRYWLLPWVQHPVPEKAAWLNVPFFFLRNGIGLLLLVVLSVLFLFYSLRAQVGAAVEQRLTPLTPLYAWLTRGWRGSAREGVRCRRALHVLSPSIIVAYAFIFSLMGFDLIMSLDPHWYSTLLGGYFFMSSLYLALAGIAALTILLRRMLRLEAHIATAHFHDLGKLLFGFDMLVIGLLWSQFIVIWYGNITEETQYVILRTQDLPWAIITWVALLAAFLGPLVVFFNRRVKQDPFALLPMGLVITGGLWLERYVLVVPSLWHGPAAPLGFPELFISAGFASLAAISYLAFIRCFPILPWPSTPVGTRHEA
jgi:Ni/Fe-hydrogenase subunit HybB-like protein